MDCSTPGLPVHHQLLELTQTHVHRVSDAIQPSHPPSSPSLPAFSLSQHQGLSKWVSSSHQVAKVLEFQLRHQSCQWIFRLISFRMDWLDLLAVQGTLKSLLQHHSSKASILRCSAFFIVQLSHPYMTAGKTTALIRWTIVGKIMSLLFNMLSRLVITFLPRSKRLLISWLQSPSAVILEPPKNEVCHCFHCFSIYFHEMMGPDVTIFVFWIRVAHSPGIFSRVGLNLPLGDSSWTTPQPEDPASLSHFCSFTCFPGGSRGKEPTCQCKRHKRHGFNPWVQKIPWRRKWQPTSVFLPEKSHGQRSLMGYTVHGVTMSWTRISN